MAFWGEQKSFCVLQLAKAESIITVQSGFRTKYHTEPPTDKTIREWYRKFEETDCLCAAKRTGQPGSLLETVDHVRESFTRSPKKLTRRPSQELEMSHVTVWCILRKRLACKPYRLQLFQRWIGRTSNEDSALIPWPPRSPDLTPCDLFLWDYVKDKFTCPFYQEIYQIIVAAVDTTDVNMLQRVWQELDHRIDVCRVTRGEHMEHL
jgi:hypothetical protein